jgi:serine/threonine-protein phosphatase PGAM5
MTSRLLYLVRHGEYASSDGTPSDEATLTKSGEEQARLTAERLRDVPFTAIHHSPLPRAARTAELIAAAHPGVPVTPTDLLVECIPAVPPAAELTRVHQEFFASFTPEELDESREQAAQAIARFAGPDGPSPELLVSHGNLINWFVTRAIGGPDSGWLRLLDYHCAVTVIAYLPDRVKVAAYNDAGHLPARLRGTDYPPELRV